MDAPTAAAIAWYARASTVAPTRGERPDAALRRIRKHFPRPSLIYSLRADPDEGGAGRREGKEKARDDAANWIPKEERK